MHEAAYPTTQWRDEYALMREVFWKIDAAARVAGFNGVGDGEPVRPKTLGEVVLADTLFVDAHLGQLPTWLHDEAVNRCRRIVATSSQNTCGHVATSDSVAQKFETQNGVADPTQKFEKGTATVESEATIAAKAVDVAQRLGLDGNLDESHEWADLSDDAQRVAARMLDEYLEASQLPRDLAVYSRRVACSLAGSSSEERIAAAVLRLRMLPDPLEGTDADAESAQAEWQQGERPRPRAIGPVFSSGDLTGLAAAIRGGAVR